MAFWGNSLSDINGDPKRKFRWKVSFGGQGVQVGDDSGVVWFAKTVSRPEITVGDTEHKFYGHTFKFPGSVTWNDIDVELVDPVSPDAAKQTLDIFHRAGYRFAGEGFTTGTGAFASMTKGTATAALKPFVISLLNDKGDPIEQWELHNPFLSKIGFDQLDYGSDDLTTISLSVKYDWATFTGVGPAEQTADLFKHDGSYTPGS